MYIVYVYKKLLQMQVFNTTLKEEVFGYALDIISYNIQLVEQSNREDIEKWLREYNTENIESSNIVRQDMYNYVHSFKLL